MAEEGAMCCPDCSSRVRVSISWLTERGTIDMMGICPFCVKSEGKRTVTSRTNLDIHTLVNAYICGLPVHLEGE